MSWYTAKCRFRSIHTGEEPPHETVGEYRFFLLKADNEEGARDKAQIISKRKEHSYKNKYGATVSWCFESVVDVKEVIDGGFVEGTEIYSEYFPIT